MLSSALPLNCHRGRFSESRASSLKNYLKTATVGDLEFTAPGYQLCRTVELPPNRLRGHPAFTASGDHLPNPLSKKPPENHDRLGWRRIVFAIKFVLRHAVFNLFAWNFDTSFAIYSPKHSPQLAHSFLSSIFLTCLMPMF